MKLVSKFCHTCKIDKPIDEFYFANKAKTVYAVNCKLCTCARTLEYGRKHPDKRLERQRKYVYGITPEEFAELFERQKGRCAICSTPLSVSGRKTHLDHKRDIVRGLLCRGCNLGLGNFDDNTGKLLAAVEYLRSTTPSDW